MTKFNPVTEEVLEALRAIVGAEFVKNDVETLERYKTDEEPDPHYHHLPEVVVLPGSTEEVAAIMKLANKYLVPVTPRSAGTSVSCGAIPVCGGIVLLLERMDKIIEMNTEAMYMVVEAGARVEYVITDKKVTISVGQDVNGTDTFPVYIEKHRTV